MHDPFEQFERSRNGLVIPLVLFFAGAVPTALAIRAMTVIEATQAEAAGSDAADRLAPSDATPESTPTPQDTAHP